MEKDKISIKFLIHLVGERPALWDKTSADYKNREIKETSWREICSFINENFEQLPAEGKASYTKMVIKKWTHTRDAWVKSMKYGYDEITKLPPKPYVYHDELKFLNKILRYKQYHNDLPSYPYNNLNKQELLDDTLNTTVTANTSGELTQIPKGENADDDFEWPAADDIPTPTAMIETELGKKTADQNKKPTNKMEEMKCQIQSNPLRIGSKVAPTPTTTFLNNPLHERNLNENRHFNFFKSIFRSLNCLDDDHTLQFQAGVIELLQKLKSSQKKMQIKSYMKYTKRTRQDDEDSEGEAMPKHKAKGGTRYSTRKAKQILDPIAFQEADNVDDDSGSDFMESV